MSTRQANAVKTSRSETGSVQGKDSSVPRALSRQQSAGARKSLPQIPQSDGSPLAPTPSSMSIDRCVSVPVGDASYQPFFLEYALMAEYKMLLKEKIPGVYVVPSAKSALVWNGVVFVRQQIYQDGIFRFTVNIPPTFPECDCPSVTFTPPVFHPFIDPVTGSLDVARAFHRWRRNVNHITQILTYIRRIFLKIDTQNPVNQEAADLYEKELDKFKQRVLGCVQRSKDTLYDDPDPADAHAIRFSMWDSAVHGPARQQMLAVKNDAHTHRDDKSADTSTSSGTQQRTLT